MSQRKPLVAVPRGIIDVPVTPFTPDNKVDLDTFGRVHHLDGKLRRDACALERRADLGLVPDQDRAEAACHLPTGQHDTLDHGLRAVIASHGIDADAGDRSSHHAGLVDP